MDRGGVDAMTVGREEKESRKRRSSLQAVVGVIYQREGAVCRMFRRHPDTVLTVTRLLVYQNSSPTAGMF